MNLVVFIAILPLHFLNILFKQEIIVFTAKLLKKTLIRLVSFFLLFFCGGRGMGAFKVKLTNKLLAYTKSLNVVELCKTNFSLLLAFRVRIEKNCYFEKLRNWETGNIFHIFSIFVTEAFDFLVKIFSNIYVRSRKKPLLVVINIYQKFFLYQFLCK